MVSKKLFYQIHQRLVEIFNVPNILFAGKSVLVVGDLYQLPPVNAMPVYASPNSCEPEINVADELWKMFRLVQLTEVMCQRGDTSFIYLLNQIRVGHIDESSEMIIQSRFKDSEDSNYPKQALHIFAENAPALTHNDTMLNQLAGLPIEIETIDIGPSNCGFTESDIIAAQNRKPSDTGDLVKCLTLKLEAKVIPTVNVDVQGRLINGQIGVVKHLEIIENKVSIIYVKFDDPDAGKKLITKNSTARIHNWVPIKRHETSIIIRNTNKSIAIKRTQFPLRLLWACAIHKVQALSLQEAVVSFDLERQKIFKPGQMYVALSRVTNIQGLFLTLSFKQDAIKASEIASQEYDGLHNEALFIPPIVQSPLPKSQLLCLTPDL